MEGGEEEGIASFLFNFWLRSCNSNCIRLAITSVCCRESTSRPCPTPSQVTATVYSVLVAQLPRDISSPRAAPRRVTLSTRRIDGAATTPRWGKKNGADRPTDGHRTDALRLPLDAAASVRIRSSTTEGPRDALRQLKS